MQKFLLEWFTVPTAPPQPIKRIQNRKGRIQLRGPSTKRNNNQTTLESAQPNHILTDDGNHQMMEFDDFEYDMPTNNDNSTMNKKLMNNMKKRLNS